MESFSKFRKSLFKTVKYVHKKTGYLSFVILFDILWCMIRYGSSIKEYKMYEFYNIDSTLRNSFVTKRRIKKINRKLVDNSISNVITDKKLFMLRFKEYVNKSIINISDYSYKELEDYISSSKKIIARSNATSFIKTYREYNTSTFRSPAYLEKEIKDKKLLMIEKKIDIHKDLRKIDDFIVINVLSVFTNKCNILASSMKFKDKDNKLISGYIDVNSGCIVGNLKDKDYQNFKNLDGFKIPCYEKIIKMCEKLSKELEEIKQVEWSFIVDNEDNVYLADASIYDDYIFAQNPEFIKHKMGMMKFYDKII